MAEKIDLLKHELPSFLVEHRSLYSILSLGIHELDEDACLTHFDVVKTGIELILDQKAQEEKQRRKMAAASKEILQTLKKLKK
ncbi:hypothetical protein [Prosthecobacter sp.]|uniref:hypothetical protein n=1 Tax=Prosthecobacter sp. TaxID=1965333 RepID=UPI002487782F|nr:hypothetical protein [Prosthecobacter sp.]MDI1315098.1 hypothetical protein [Prosthecobacter sp.]